MGSLHSFKCEKCGYDAEVSGGEDAGFEVATRTMVCANCRELVDVVVSERKDLNEDYAPIPERCPNCRGDRVEPWSKHSKQAVSIHPATAIKVPVGGCS